MKQLLTAAALLLTSHLSYAQDELSGAWKLKGAGEPQTVRIIEDGYFMQTVFDQAGKKFISTLGGTIDADQQALKETIEFNTADKDNIGTTKNCTYVLKENKQLAITCEGKTEQWERIDDGKTDLAGTWRITGRENNGQMTTMRPGARKTLKILSGTRFQWAAINPETKEFFGTGGGTYTFENGKYTETITFFSRDNTRVGMSLSFDGKVDGNKWHHSGKSSKGDPISEIWSRIE
ncbi:membrane or secreted protein [Chitinophaga sp. XS-30]|uniref:membrane or secreted protein n=1 Tax=Chitinophaga sp. XS-30 TaxID=2604421 RepID=UPI0011DC7448|nr:membrane or secreted protein [Chitinophaga sp. XS-30]QEH43331.1 membrane or secreted protein [Chitinophaga sp. XS-30]